MQEFPVVVYKASFPSVLQQFKPQVFRVVTVFLYAAVPGLHLCLLVTAVIGETPDSDGISFFYYTALQVINKASLFAL